MSSTTLTKQQSANVADHFGYLLEAGDILRKGRRATVVMVLTELTEVRAAIPMHELERTIIGNCRGPGAPCEGDEDVSHLMYLLSETVTAMSFAGICRVTTNAKGVRYVELAPVMTDYLFSDLNLDSLD